MESGVVRQLPVGRHLALDEREVALRATWHLDQGFLNLSLWRADRCTETFHLAPEQAADLVSFVVGGLAEAATVPPTSRPVPPSAPRAPFAARARRRIAASLDGLAAAIRPGPR